MPTIRMPTRSSYVPVRPCVPHHRQRPRAKRPIKDRFFLDNPALWAEVVELGSRNTLLPDCADHRRNVSRDCAGSTGKCHPQWGSIPTREPWPGSVLIWILGLVLIGFPFSLPTEKSNYGVNHGAV